MQQKDLEITIADRSVKLNLKSYIFQVFYHISSLLKSYTFQILYASRQLYNIEKYFI